MKKKLEEICEHYLVLETSFSSYSCHHHHSASAYINLYHYLEVLKTRIVVSSQIPELQATVECRSKVYELRSSMCVVLLLKEQSLCFPKLW